MTGNTRTVKNSTVPTPTVTALTSCQPMVLIYSAVWLFPALTATTL